MIRRNYNVYANIRISRRSSRRFATIIDTGSGPILIRKDVLPEYIWKRITSATNNVLIRDDNNSSDHVYGTIDLVGDIGGSVETIRFNVVERCESKCIIGCDYCDKNVETIRPRKSIIELEEGAIVLIIRKPALIPKDIIPLP